MPPQKAEAYKKALVSCYKSAALGVVKGRAKHLLGSPRQPENRPGTQETNATDALSFHGAL